MESLDSLTMDIWYHSQNKCKHSSSTIM